MNYIIATNTINRSRELVERSLRSSLKQILPPLKVILVDQNDNELVLSEDILDNPLFERQKVPHKGVSAARNSLRIPGNTEWIFFCDDDGYPDQEYSLMLEKTIKTNRDIEILAGSIIREDTNEYYTLRHTKGGSLKHFRNTKNLMGSNFVIRTDTFERLGRFDERFGAGSYWGSSEETDFCWKAYFAGVKMEYFPGLKVYHVPPFNESIQLGFTKSFKYGVGKGALVWKWLFRKGKLIVLYELAEMTAVPLIQMVRGLLSFKFQLIVNNFATLTGRLYGLFKAPFIKLPKSI